MNLFDNCIITGTRAIIKSYAKINLTLDITGRRSDGYHDIRTIMQTISLFDLIIADKRKSRIAIKTNLSYLPTDEKNLMYKAASLFFEKSSVKGGISIILHKNIPVAAGLAGGSGNAAAVLCALNALYDFPFSNEELADMSVLIGADVPYCLMGGTALAEGIGEKLTPLPNCPNMTLLLVKPAINISTPDIYHEFDASDNVIHPNTEAMLSAIERGDILKIAENLSNTFEIITEKKYPVISGIKEKMMKNGALAAAMSGSGPTVFGLFDNLQSAKSSADSFHKQFREVFLCKTFN